MAYNNVQLKQSLKEQALFEKLEDVHIERILTTITTEAVPPDEDIIEEGETC